MYNKLDSLTLPLSDKHTSVLTTPQLRYRPLSIQQNSLGSFHSFLEDPSPSALLAWVIFFNLFF